MKAHQSHDILLLCPTCHEVSNCHDLQLRRKLADMCGAPLAGPLTHIRNKYVNNWRKLQSAVKALRERTTLPDARRKELERYILDCTDQQEVTPNLLDLLYKELKNAVISMPNHDQTKCQPHGLKVFNRRSWKMDIVQDTFNCTHVFLLRSRSFNTFKKGKADW